jgi:hypothetical protein
MAGRGGAPGYAARVRFPRRQPSAKTARSAPMHATATNVMHPARGLPSRRPVEGPSAWIGAHMRRREAEWSYRLTPAQVVEIDSAVEAVRGRGLDLADIRREDFPLPTLGPVLDRLRAEVLHGRGFALLRGMRSRTGRFPRARPPIGGSAPISAAPARRTPRGICSGMSMTSARGSARPTPTCAAMPPPSGRISISTAATSSRSSAYGGRSQAGCRRSSAR